MSNRAKYLSLLAMTAFVVGQVQYSYTSYFCTMLNSYVPSPSMALASHHEASEATTCDDCQVDPAPASGHQLVEANCFHVTTAEKSVVDNFVGSTNPDIHFVAAVVSFLPVPLVARTLSSSWASVPSADSPPLDLPTLNCNLRI